MSTGQLDKYTGQVDWTTGQKKSSLKNCTNNQLMLVEGLSIFLVAIDKQSLYPTK